MRRFSPILSGAAGGCALAALALAAGLAAVRADALGALPRAGVALAAVLLALPTALLLGRRLPSARQAALLGGIALAASVLAAEAASSLPSDLHVRSLGRPPAFLSPMAAALAAVALAASIEALRGCPAPRSLLVLAVPAALLGGHAIGVEPRFLALWSFALFALGAAPPAGPPGATTSALRRLALLAASFLAVASLSAVLGADPATSERIVGRSVACALPLFLVLLDPEPRRAARRSLLLFVGATTCAALLGLSTRLLLARAVEGYPVDVLGSELALFDLHPNLVAPWFGAAAAAAVLLALERGGLRRAAFAAQAGVCFAAVGLTASRLTLAATLGALFIPLALRLPARRRLATALLALAALTAGAALLVPALRRQVTGALSATAPADTYRVHRMKVAWRTALERPLLGTGPGCFFLQGPHTPPSRFDGQPSDDHAHNVFLAVFEQTGLLGLALLLLLLAATAKAVRPALRTAPYETGAALAALGVLLLAGLADVGGALLSLLPPSLLLLAGVVAAHAVSERKTGAAARVLGPTALAAGLAALLCAVPALGVTARAVAHAQVREGRPADALRAFRLAVRLRPYDPDLRLERAGLALALGRPAAGRADVEEALARAPDRPDVRLEAARWYAAAGDARRAFEQARRAQETDPHGVTPRVAAPMLCEAAFALGREDEGVRPLARALLSDPGVALRWRDPGRADRLVISGREVRIERLVEAMENLIPPDASVRLRRRPLLREAELRFALGDPEGALSALERLRLRFGEDWPDLFLRRSQVLLALGRTAEAREAARELGRRVHDPNAALQLARVAVAENRLDQARAALEEALAVSYDVSTAADVYAEALGLLADVERRAGREAALRRALRARAFFESDPERRAAVLLDLLETESEPRVFDREAARALRLLLSGAPSASRRRALERLGRRVASSYVRGRGTTTRFADRWEREAARLAGLRASAPFRLALLENLGLEERARQARSLLER